MRDRARTLALLVAATLAGGCERAERSAPRGEPMAIVPRAMFEPELEALLQRLDPLPGGEARKVVLAVRGVPIRRGDFERILDHWLPTLDPDIALQPLRESALLNELLPRALAMSALPRAELEAIAAALERGRGAEGRYDIEALARALAPLSGAANDPSEIFELQVERKRNAQPLIAREGPRLARAGAQAGPVVTRDGVFVFERVETSGAAGPEAPSAPLAPALWVRAASLTWPLRGADGEPLRGPALRQRVDELLGAAIRAKEVQVLDPEYADAVPRWLPPQ